MLNLKTAGIRSFLLLSMLIVAILAPILSLAGNERFDRKEQIQEILREREKTRELKANVSPIEINGGSKIVKWGKHELTYMDLVLNYAENLGSWPGDRKRTGELRKTIAESRKSLEGLEEELAGEKGGDVGSRIGKEKISVNLLRNLLSEVLFEAGEVCKKERGQGCVEAAILLDIVWDKDVLRNMENGKYVSTADVTKTEIPKPLDYNNVNFSNVTNGICREDEREVSEAKEKEIEGKVVKKEVEIREKEENESNEIENEKCEVATKEEVEEEVEEDVEEEVNNRVEEKEAKDKVVKKEVEIIENGEKESNEIEKKEAKQRSFARDISRDSSQPRLLEEGDAGIVGILFANSRNIFSRVSNEARINGKNRQWVIVDYYRTSHKNLASKTNSIGLTAGYSPLMVDDNYSLTIILSGTSLEGENSDSLKGELGTTSIGAAIRGRVKMVGNLGTSAIAYYGHNFNKASLDGVIAKKMKNYSSYDLGFGFGMDYELKINKIYSLAPAVTVDYLNSRRARQDDLSERQLTSINLNYILDNSISISNTLEMTLGVGYSQMITLGKDKSLYRDVDSLNFSVRLDRRLSNGGGKLSLNLVYITVDGADGLVNVFRKGFSGFGKIGLGLGWMF
ncbi:MAG: autotransporter outer membrane beta-barrel domain-containing protein [Rickettsiales bacterium]|nr:autotransporter outer membrane beta-barrel domain-containing protein [Rickettsiales bacterium]